MRNLRCHCKFIIYAYVEIHHNIVSSLQLKLNYNFILIQKIFCYSLRKAPPHCVIDNFPRKLMAMITFECSHYFFHFRTNDYLDINNAKDIDIFQDHSPINNFAYI